MLKMAAPLDFFDASRRAEAPSSGGWHTCPLFCIIPHLPSARKGFCTRRAGKFGAGGCRGRCRSQPFATKERYGCGSAACRYTSARGAVAHSPEISVKSVHAAWADVGIGPYKRIWGYIRIRRGIFVFGGAGCGRSNRRFARHPVGADAHIGPWGSCAFAGDFRKIGACRVGRCRHRPLQTDLGVHTDSSGDFRIRRCGLRRRAPEGGGASPRGAGKPGCA